VYLRSLERDRRLGRRPPASPGARSNGESAWPLGSSVAIRATDSPAAVPVERPSRPHEGCISRRDNPKDSDAELLTSAVLQALPGFTPERHRSEPGGPGGRCFKPLRHVSEPINDTLHEQLDLKRHGGPLASGMVQQIEIQ
jgi:hypothetical protein